MNDIERLAEKLETAVQNVETLASLAEDVDGRTAVYIDGAVGKLYEARATLEEIRT